MEVALEKKLGALGKSKKRRGPVEKRKDANKNEGPTQNEGSPQTKSGVLLFLAFGGPRVYTFNTGDN